MSWPLTLLVALLCAVAGGLAAGYITSLCADWYSLSNFEGAAGYFIISVSILSAFAAAIIGGIAARVVSAGFPHALGAGLAGVAVPAALVLLIAWARADIPPKIGGQTLAIHAELMLPPGASITPELRDAKDNALILNAVIDGSHVRDSATGSFDFDAARTDSGRHILPGVVFLFTSSGARHLVFRLQGREVARFDAPIPAHPDAALLEWSSWFPAGEATHRYRFRLRHAAKGTPTEETADNAERALAASITPESPIFDWLQAKYANAHFNGQRDQDRANEVLVARAAEIPPLAYSLDPRTRRLAGFAIPVFCSGVPFPPADPLVAALQKAINDADPQALAAVHDAIADFHHIWSQTSRSTAAKAPAGFDKILHAAEARKADPVMAEIADLARKILAVP